MSDLLFTAGDTAPTLTGVCRDGDDPANLTGATSVIIHIRRPVSALISRAVTVTDAAGGAWSLDWQVGDLVDVGVHESEVEVVFSNAQRQTFGPDTFTVQAQLA